MNYLLSSLEYVINNDYFWVSMAMTTTIGVFIGSVLYDGVLKEVKKVMVVMLSYTLMIVTTNSARILPIINSGNAHSINQPFAGIATTILVTVFYILGMWLGVKITNHAHKGRES